MKSIAKALLTVALISGPLVAGAQTQSVRKRGRLSTI
jgi:hypothetical protein